MFVCPVDFQIYRQELENIVDFNGFNDWLHSFPLYRGKKTSDDDDDEHRIVGKFKVKHCDSFLCHLHYSLNIIIFIGDTSKE